VIFQQTQASVAALRAKEAELMTGLQNREGLATEAEAEFGDQIQRALDRALVIDALDRSSVLLREVQAALARAQDGSYGVCLRCEEPISDKRLAAVPWAAYCLGCQERRDRQPAFESAESDFASLL
jgi:DnaK suppressor protein